MIKKFWHQLNSTVGGGAILIAFFSVISKLLGLVRDRLFAGTFGAGQELDIFFAAFKIPDAIFNILVLGALTSAFIPIFQKTWSKDKEDGLRLANSVLNLLLIIIACFCLILTLGAPYIVPGIVPGFDPAAQQATVQLTRILLISLLFFTFSNVLSGVLNSWHKFFSFALSSVLYNLGIIAGTVILYPIFGLAGLAWGVVVGSALHLLVQLCEALARGWRYRRGIFFSAELRRIFTLMVPRMIGLAGFQFSWLFMTIVASSLAPGSLSIFSLAYNLQSFPVSIFGISLAVAAFPTIINLISDNDTIGLKKFLIKQISRILFYLIPIAVFMLIMRAQIVRIILGTGAFDWTDTILTANSLGIFALAIVAQGLIPLLSRAFYAHEDTKTPVIISLISVTLNAVLAVLFSQKYGILGLTASFSLASIVNLLLLFVILRIRIGDFDDAAFISMIIRLSAASVVAGLTAYGLLYWAANFVNMQTFIGVLTQLLIAGIGGLTVYLLIARIARFPEMDFLKLKRSAQ